MEKYIQIGKKPFIYEEDDRWGRPLGTYAVMEVVGFAETGFWENLKKFESYGHTPESKAEMESAAKQVADGIEMSKIVTPIMTELINRAKSLMWEFNMLLELPFDGQLESNYIRSFGMFGEMSLVEWNEERQKELDEMKLVCEDMNKKATPKDYND